MSKRKFLTAEEKVAIVRRHLVENVPVSDLCEEFGIYATQYNPPLTFNRLFADSWQLA